MGCARPLSRQYYLLLITVVRVYCCTQRCKKKAESEKTRLFFQIFVIGGILIEGARPPWLSVRGLGAPWLLATPMILIQDCVLKFFHKKTFKAKFKKKVFPKRGELVSSHLTVFIKPPEIARHYYDVDTWSSLLLLILLFRSSLLVSVNPTSKKLQFRTRKTYSLCSHYIYHW